MLKTASGFFIALALFASTGVEARAAEKEALPICGLLVAKKRRAEVLAQGTYDKFRHCAASCVLTLACGPLDSFEIGVLKEAYDALGFGDPSMDDLRADVAGTQLGIARDVKSRADCYRECDRVYPRNLKPRETNSGVPGA